MTPSGGATPQLRRRRDSGEAQRGRASEGEGEGEGAAGEGRSTAGEGKEAEGSRMAGKQEEVAVHKRGESDRFFEGKITHSSFKSVRRVSC